MSSRYTPRRVDVDVMLGALAYISRHSGVTTVELAGEMGVSERTMRRVLQVARDRYRVAVHYVAEPRPGLPNHGELTLDDWGVLDGKRVRRWYRGGT